MERVYKYKGLVAFIVVAVIILCGYEPNALKIAYLTCAHSYHLLIGDYTANEYSAHIKNLFSGDLSYHNELVDLNSLLLRYSGTSYVVKDDETVVKMKNGYLTYEVPYIADEDILESADKINSLYEFSRDHGAEFLYTMCPVKGYSGEFPAGIDNHIKTNCDRFADALINKGVPALVLQDEMEKEGITEEEAFFVTDHHWTPNTGFWALGKICSTLNSLYGFEYNKDYTDISNYSVETYKDWFLGSQGKKTGIRFSELGVDDIDLIMPKFETSLTEEQPFKEESRTGEFIDTALFLENLETKDYYHKNPYATYSGGDFRLQIFKNHLNNTGKKILVIRDSFACAVTPFLALEADTLYILDVREGDYYVGEKPSVYALIEEYSPDYVVVVYTNVARGSSLDFGYIG